MTYTEKMQENTRKHGFTRRNCEFTAYVISKMPPRTRKEVASAFAGELMNTPGFNMERFLRACGVV